MQVTEKTREKIKERADKMSDFLKMEYLELCLKQIRDVNVLRFCSLELSKLYERTSMFSDAVKYTELFESLCASDRERTMAALRETELLIKGGQYERADSSFKKALINAKESEKFEIKKRIIDLYKSEAEKFEKLNRYNWATKAYEKLLKLVSDHEKIEAKKRLFNLYKKLGKVKESLEIEKELQRLSFIN